MTRKHWAYVYKCVKTFIQKSIYVYISGGGYSINSLPGRGGHGHQSYDEILISGSGPPHHSNTIDRTGGTSSRNSTTEGKDG